MHQSFLKILFFTSLIAISLSNKLPASDTLPHNNQAMEMEQIMNKIYPKDFPGAALLVIRNGETIFNKGFGLADLKTGEAVSPSTHFRMASVSKQFTAMCILILQKQGKLNIEDPARKYLPALPAFAKNITIQNLMTHTSGIADYESLIPESRKSQVSDADVLEMIAHSGSLYFAPGSLFRYSNTGFCLLTQIVEKVSGMAYPEFIRQNIFQPLNMVHSTIYQNGKSIFHRAYGYHFKDGEWHFADQSLTSATMGDGSVYTSTDEYKKWIQFLWNESFPSDKLNPLRPHTDIKPWISYGYGWFISQDSDGTACYFHSGESTGFHNVVYHNPAKKLLIVLFTNSDDDRAARAFDQISSVLNIHVKGIPAGDSLFDFLSNIYGD